MKNEIVTCPVDDFINHYLPFAPAAVDVMVGRERLISQGHLLKDKRWAKFMQCPSSQPAHGNDVFEPIGKIANSLAGLKLTASVTGSLKTSHQVFYAKPQAKIVGETEGESHIVNGILCPRITEGSKEHASDVALVFEYKKRSDYKNIAQNRHQIVSAANYIMNNDPRRLFTYGITIEDALVSVWYFSRSHSAKSKEFDFLENPDLFITILLSFLFATDESVGFDPNIQRRPVALEQESRHITYIYRLVEKDENGDDKERYFETQRTISKPRRPCIAGRATHVMEAKELASKFGEPPVYKENARTVVLRDVWLDEGSLTERDTQTSIFEDLETFARNLPPDGSSPHFADFDDAMKDEILSLLKDEKYRAYFLTISCEAVGFKSKDIHPNAVVDPFLLSQSHMQLHSSCSGNGADSDGGSVFTSRFTQSAPNADLPVGDYKPKRSYRLVYEECCVDLYSKELTSIHDAFVVLKDALTALTLLFCAGWVHRDVSCGNVLLWRDSDGRPHGKLGDLEYAKRFPSTTVSSDPKTGTAYFIAVEVARNIYFPPPPERGVRKPRSPIQYNFRHDVESLWWLILWVIACRVGNAQTMYRTQSVFVTDMVSGSSARSDLLTGAPDLTHLLEDLDPSLKPFIPALDDTRDLLWFSYSQQTQTGDRTTIGPYSDMYRNMRQLLSTAIDGDGPRMMNGMVDVAI